MMQIQPYVPVLLAAGLLALAGCDAAPLAPGADLRLPTQIGAPHSATLEAMPLSDHRDEPPVWIVVASPAQEVRVEVEGGEPLQARSQLDFLVATDGTARGGGRLIISGGAGDDVLPAPAVEYIVLLALVDNRLLRFEGTGVAHDFPRGREQTVRIDGSIQLPSAGAHLGGLFVAAGDVNAYPEGNPALTWAIQARVIILDEPEAQPARPTYHGLGP